VECRRNGERLQGSIEPIALGVFDEDAGFQNRLGQLLDEQRVAVGLGHDLFCHLGRQRAAAGHSSDHAFNVVAFEAAECQSADIG